MWAQEWNQIYDIVVPYPDEDNIDVTPVMISKGWTTQKMVETAENFFTEMGLESMTDTFWRESVFKRPNDETEMECHASAEDFFSDTDFR